MSTHNLVWINADSKVSTYLYNLQLGEVLNNPGQGCPNVSPPGDRVSWDGARLDSTWVQGGPLRPLPRGGGSRRAARRIWCLSSQVGINGKSPSCLRVLVDVCCEESSRVVLGSQLMPQQCQNGRLPIQTVERRSHEEVRRLPRALTIPGFYTFWHVVPRGRSPVLILLVLTKGGFT